MAIGYTEQLKYANPDAGECNWNYYWYKNQDQKDVIEAALLSKSRVKDGCIVSDQGSFVVGWTAGNVRIVDTDHAISGGTIAVSAASPDDPFLSNYIWLDNTATVNSTTTLPTGNFIPLAVIDTDQTTVLRVVDIRPIDLPGSGGGGLNWSGPITTNQTGITGSGYAFDTTSAGLTLTLPATPSQGDQVGFRDYTGSFATNNLTVARNGENIEGSATDLTISTDSIAGTLTYIDSTIGWLYTSNYSVGGSPVLSTKPMLHTQYQELSGVLPTAIAGGMQDIPINTVVENEISGASLNVSTGVITLPTGTYYIDGTYTRSGGVANEASRAYIRNGTNKLLSGTNAFSLALDWTNSNLAVSGKVVLSATTDIKLSRQSSNADGVGNRAVGNGDNEVYADLRIWRLDSAAAIYVDAPELALNKPLLHVEDRKTTGTAGATMVAGYNDRELNTVVTNEISGATLSSNNITLPSGIYYFKADSILIPNGFNVIRKADDSILLRGIVESSSPSYRDVAMVSGRVELTESTTIKLSSYSAAGAIAAMSIAPYEVYSSIKIWKIDSVIQSPVLGNNLIYPIPGNVYKTGDIYDLNLSKTAANEVTVSTGACLDSTNQIPLYLSSNTAISLPLVSDTIYHIFLVRLTGTTTYELRYSTDIDGTGLTGIDALRWLGFILNTSSGVIAEFSQNGDLYSFHNSISDTVIATLTTSYISYDLTSIVPTTRLTEIFIVQHGTSSMWLSYDGTITAIRTYAGIASAPSNETLITARSSIYAKASSAQPFGIYSVRLKR